MDAHPTSPGFGGSGVHHTSLDNINSPASVRINDAQTSPFFIFSSLTFLSHTSSAFLFALLLWAFSPSITSSVIYRLSHSYLLHILCFLQSYLDGKSWALGLCKLKYSLSVQGYVRLCMTAFHSSCPVSTGCSLHGIEFSPTIFHGRLCKGGGR